MTPRSMKNLRILPLVCIISLGLLGCERPEKMVDNLRKEITEFRAAPDDQKSASIEKNLTQLDSEIAKLRTQGNTEKANFLQEQKDSLASDFGAAKVYRTLQDAKSTLKGSQDSIQKNDKDEQGGGSPVQEPSASETATPEITPETTATPEASMPEATPEASTPEASPQGSVPEASSEASPTDAASPEASPVQ